DKLASKRHHRFPCNLCSDSAVNHSTITDINCCPKLRLEL
ncbi:hypothetical protein AVDCRST_MAG94-3546, partial [uncultured Leptolyngbya sp.]